MSFYQRRMKSEDHFVMPQIKVGDTGPNFVAALARMYPQLKSLIFTIYLPTPGVRELIADAATSRPVAEVINLFLHHDNSSNKKWHVQANELSSRLLVQKITSLPPHLALGIDSKCTLQDDTTSYIPMMDFLPPPNIDNLELLKEFLNRIGYEGIIVESGASYHFYGFNLLNHAEWIAFMGKCLLVPWSDPRWVGHSLIAGNGVLRISATKLKQKLPSVREILRR
jgi:hypothetical protein